MPKNSIHFRDLHAVTASLAIALLLVACAPAPADSPGVQPAAPVTNAPVRPASPAGAGGSDEGAGPAAAAGSGATGSSSAGRGVPPANDGMAASGGAEAAPATPPPPPPPPPPPDAGSPPAQPRAPLDSITVARYATGVHVTQQAGPVVRFIAVGDTGTGEPDQARVAAAMRDTCERDGCDFVVLLGDNIYEGGPTGVDDPQWQSKFEQPYAGLDVPFYAVLGNHDVGVLPGLGYNPWAVPIEVDYTAHSAKWKMPAAHYTVSVGNVGLLVFDSTALYNHVVEQGDQNAWVGPARDALLAEHDWVFAAAHHTYVSNGDHGNAGAYAYLDFDPGIEIAQFVESHLCGQVDMLLTGHDHNRQWLDESLCMGTDVVVSGAGAKTRGVLGINPVHFASDKLGFFHVVVDGDTLIGRFIDDLGRVDFEKTMVK